MSHDFEAMNIEQSCQEIIKCVSKSHLNYAVNLTPYSLYLTIRKSFSKNKIQPKSHPVPYVGGKGCDHPDQLELQIEQLKIDLKKAEAKNHSLKFELEEALEDSENTYKENKFLRERISEYEDKTDATSNQAKINSDALIKLKKENSELLELVKDGEKESKGLKKSLSEKDKKLYNLEKEIKEDAEKSRDLKSKFDELTNKVNQDKKQQERKLKKKENMDFLNKMKNESETPSFKCQECDVKVETISMLKFHVRTLHMSSVQTQTDEKETKEQKDQTDTRLFKPLNTIQTPKKEFEKYPCFYCVKDITSELQALEHRVECHGATDTPSLFSFPVRQSPMLFKCVLCGLGSSCETDIVDHKKSVHGSN